MAKQLPIVTIIGRQNVGKSTLFNALIRQKKAIVDSMPGLTRDILSFRVTHADASFMISDTPGLDIEDSSLLSQAILENAKNFLSRSAVIILLLENPAPASFDLDLAEIVRKLGLPVIIAVNKMDGPSDFQNMPHFYEMGFDDILPISALNRINIALLLDKIVDRLPVRRLHSEEEKLKIAIVGRPNAGKSTLLNAFIGYERSIVSDIPGTTRDAVDEDFVFNGRKITLIDTAGIRKKSRITENVDFYSLRRAVESIRRCDVVIHLIDAAEGITDTDKKIADEIIAARKPTIIAVNKWDAIEKDHKTFDAYKDRLIFTFYRAGDFPIISISAREKQRIHRLVTTAIELSERALKRVETPRLNRIMEEIQRSHHIPTLGGKLKIYYLTQTGVKPPRFKLFVNNPEHFRKDLLRHIEKALQRKLELTGIPVDIQIEGKKR
ncbi:MAG: ribosome biogenesis GTPase Der [Spirochaetota bacterium]|jgi:GTP-binding protein